MDWLRSIQLGLTVIPLCLAPLFFGSVDRLSVAVWVALLSAAMLCGVTLPINTAQRRILLGFFAVCGAYAVVAIIQVIPGLVDGSGDPIWQRLNQLLPLHVPSRISARAEIPAEALGHFLLAVTSFASGVFVGTSQRNSEILTAAARYSILLYAMYGVLAMVFTPNMLLWAPKLAYQGSLTATFVNHNTAATFIGSGLILWSCLALQTVQSLQFGSLRMLLLTSSNEHVAFKLILRLAAALTCLFALLLTGSRGGLICTSLGLFVAIGLMVTNAIRPKFWYVFASATAALTAVLIWLNQVGRVGAVCTVSSTRLDGRFMNTVSNRFDSGLCWVPVPVRLQIFFLRFGDLNSTAGASGILRTPRYWRSRWRWGFQSHWRSFSAPGLHCSSLPTERFVLP